MSRAPNGTTRVPGRMLRIRGVPTHVLCEGEGPVCVLSGGLGSSWFDWDPVVPLLAPSRTVVRFDRPGLGLSAPDPRPPTAVGEAHRILGVLDALGLTGRCTVVGHSLAGFHAEAFARLHPDRTDGLVLIDTSVEEDALPPVVPVGLRIGAARLLATALSAAGLPRALGRTARRAAVRTATVRHREPADEEFVRRCYRTSRVLHAGLLENATYPDLAAELAELRARHRLPPVPVTVLAAYAAGESRRELRWLERQRRLAAQLGGEFRISAPSGHLLMMDDPAAVARAVLGSGPRLGQDGGREGLA
ncbi:alpha/beta fold hydrolase [Streptomyces sp. KR80]|uniref:alpha/beta fold hydrolase n=1 Tax=Streptomyces sp. KR80 TaxID=3457426 RepID=UPI003FD0C917